jgi:hypothetical protein
MQYPGSTNMPAFDHDPSNVIGGASDSNYDFLFLFNSGFVGIMSCDGPDAGACDPNDPWLRTSGLDNVVQLFSEGEAAPPPTRTPSASRRCPSRPRSRCSGSVCWG